MLPLRDLRISTTPDVGSVQFGFVAEGSELLMPVRLTEVDDSSRSVQVQWNGIRLDGEPVGAIVSVECSVLNSPTDSEGRDIGECPYVHGIAIPANKPDLFIGRTSIIDQIRLQLNAKISNIVLLEGNRRTGKSSILNRLTAPDVLPGWIVVNCTLQGALGSDRESGIPTGDVFRLIARRIAEALLKEGIHVSIDGRPVGKMKIDRNVISDEIKQAFVDTDPFPVLENYISSVLQRVTPRHVLLMLDEFDKIDDGIRSGVTSSSVPENLRYLFHEYENLSGIICGSPRLKHLRESYWSALFGLGYRIPVGRLSERDGELLVTKPVQGRLQFTPDACAMIIKSTAGQPFLIQSLCTDIFVLMTGERNNTVTTRVVEQATNEMLTNNEHFRGVWENHIRSKKRQLIVAICQKYQAGPDPITMSLIERRIEDFGISIRRVSDLDSDLAALRELEVLEFNGAASNSEYRMAVPTLCLIG